MLLARATDDQTEVELHIAGVFERLPGFPDGVDAVMSIDAHTAAVPAKGPDFFLAAAAGSGDVGLERALASLEEGAGATDGLQFDTRLTTLARDQSSLAALNIAGLVDLDSASALAMAVVAIAIFVFGLLLQRRREYVTLRAQGLEPGTIRLLIAAEAGTVAAGGVIAGLLVGAAMGYYFVTVLRPLFVLVPSYSVPLGAVLMPVVLVFAATLVSVGRRFSHGEPARTDRAAPRRVAGRVLEISHGARSRARRRSAGSPQPGAAIATSGPNVPPWSSRSWPLQNRPGSYQLDGFFGSRSPILRYVIATSCAQ